MTFLFFIEKSLEKKMRGAPPPTTDQPPLISYANHHLFYHENVDCDVTLET